MKKKAKDIETVVKKFGSLLFISEFAWYKERCGSDLGALIESVTFLLVVMKLSAEAREPLFDVLLVLEHMEVITEEQYNAATDANSDYRALLYPMHRGKRLSWKMNKRNYAAKFEQMAAEQTV